MECASFKPGVKEWKSSGCRVRMRIMNGLEENELNHSETNWNAYGMK